MQVLFLVGILVLVPIFVVAPLSDGWEDWIVYGVILLVFFGGSRAVYERRYPSKKRTFVRHYDEPKS